MTDQEKRIKPAEAMDLYIVATSVELDRVSVRYDGANHGVNFNPFTDANDDYAVLEWMRDKFFEGGILRYGLWTRAIKSLVPYSRDYRIGDYARAALKVIEL